VRPDEPVEGHEVVQFWCYDIVNDKTNIERDNERRKLIPTGTTGTLVLVETYVIQDVAGVEAFKEQMLELGFEGAMMRNTDALYANKRSYDLQKCKDMTDEEFKIVDFEEGRGRLTGHVGSFWCEMPSGIRFKAKAKGKTENLRKYFQDHSLWMGKLLTVQYQNYTPDGKPRFTGRQVDKELRMKQGVCVAIGHFESIADGKVTFKADEGELPVLALGDTVAFVGDVNGVPTQIEPSMDFTGKVGIILVKSGQTVQ
jgi:hypothetical protein